MDVELKSHYYNYYNQANRYKTDKPMEAGWVKQYKQVTDRVESDNYSQNDEYFKSMVSLENAYYDVGVANRAKYSNYNDLQSAIYQKYMLSGSYDNYSQQEKTAMYRNELSMSAFGYCSDLNDPRIGGSAHIGTEQEKQEFNRSSVNSQLQNIFKNAGIDFSSLQKNNISFSIEPHDYKLSVKGLDKNDILKTQIEELLNSNNNSVELFTHVLNSTRNKGMLIPDDVMKKFTVAKSIKSVADVDFRDFKQVGNGLYNSAGENILDVFKDALKNNNRVPLQFIGDAYDDFESRVNQITSKDVNSIPDLILNIDYVNGQLIDTDNSHLLNGAKSGSVLDIKA